jgi:ribosomal protein S14
MTTLEKTPKRWSRRYDHCQRCERNSTSHYALGLCASCYRQVIIERRTRNRIQKQQERTATEARIQNIEKRGSECLLFQAPKDLTKPEGRESKFAVGDLVYKMIQKEGRSLRISAQVVCIGVSRDSTFLYLVRGINGPNRRECVTWKESEAIIRFAHIRVLER